MLCYLLVGRITRVIQVGPMYHERVVRQRLLFNGDVAGLAVI